MGYGKVIAVNIEGLGYYQTTPAKFDKAIGRYLPCNLLQLKDLLRERSGKDIYSGLETITECLIILSEFDGNNC
jgi:hypothetical protein